MKISNRNKRDAYKRFINRTGVGASRLMHLDRIDKKALEQFREKPYYGTTTSHSKRNGNGETEADNPQAKMEEDAQKEAVQPVQVNFD